MRFPEHPLSPLLLVLSFCLFSLSSQAQTLPPEVTAFPPSTYNGHHQTFCLQAFSDGRTAFGTATEVLVYDGENFRHVPVGSGKMVFSMARAPGDRLFVGGSSLMGVLGPDSSGSLTYRSLISMLPDSLRDFGAIWNTVRTEKGKVYFSAKDHLFLYQDDTVQVIRPENDFHNMYLLDSRPVIEDVDTGFFRLRGTEKAYLKGSRALARRKGVNVILPTPGKSGEWTAFTRKKGLFHYDPEKGKVRPYPRKPGYIPEGGWSAAGIYTACQLDPKSNPYGAAFAIGTQRKGLYLLTSAGRIVLHLGKGEGMPTKSLWKVSPAGGGDLWATTNNGIALIHTGLPFTIAPEGKLFSGVIRDIARPSLPSEPLFLATVQGTWSWKESVGEFGLVEGTGGQCLDLLTLPGTTDRTVEKGKKPSRLLVTGGKAVRSIERGTASLKADTILSGGFRSLTRIPLRRKEGAFKPVLAGGRQGLCIFTPGSMTGDGTAKTLLTVRDVPEGIVMVEAERTGTDPDSLRLWGTMGSKGILEVTVDTAFNGFVTTHYDTTDGLPEGPTRVFSHPDGKGVIFGTDRGAYSFKKGRFVPFCHYGEIFCDGSRQVFLMEEGVDEELWINDWKGGMIKHLLPEKEGYRIDSTCFRGMQIGAIRSVHPEKGQVWFGCDQGLACYHPEVKDDHERRWHCLVRKVTGSGDSLLFGGNEPVEDTGREGVRQLPYSKNRLEFHYAAPFTDKQEKVTYSYRLVDFDTAWSKWSDQTRKEYTNLPEGEYTFKVKANNVYGVESSTGTYRFRILPPWYRTWTAYGGYTVAGIAFIWFLLWLNSRRLVAQKQRLERTVEERTQEIREKNARLETANQEIQAEKEKVEEQKEKVEEQQKETEKQKQEVEKKNEVITQQKEEVEEAHREITASIDYAQKIQHALLQTEEYVSDHLPEHFILFKPQATVSGDFYWAREQKGHLYFAAIDCTGHGVPGAFMSMLGISQLNEIMAAKESPSPGEVLTDLRERVVSELRSGDSEEGAKDGMDAAIVKIPITKAQNEEPKRIEFAGANNPLYVVKEGIGEEPPSINYVGPSVGATHVSPKQTTVSPLQENRMRPFKRSTDGVEVKGDKMAVGYEPDAAEAFTTAELEVPPGAMLYMSSDGYADQFGGPKGKKFRYSPFKELLASIHTMAPEEQKQELDRVFEEWKGGQEQVDDVCVVGIRIGERIREGPTPTPNSSIQTL